MREHSAAYRLAPQISLMLMLAGSLLFASSASAQDSGVSLFLRPHCEEQDQTKCPLFPVRDPLTLYTPILPEGTVLDIDLVVKNPVRQAIAGVKAMIGYDSLALQGKSFQMRPEFSIQAPNAGRFMQAQGYIMVDAATSDGAERTEELIVVARLQFQILASESTTTVLSFLPMMDPTKPASGIYAKQNGEKRNILTQELPALLVFLHEEQAPSSSSTGFSTSSSGIGPSPVPTPDSGAPSTPFNLLQVQGVRVTTEGTAIFIAWNALPSTELAGYNIYYSTESGRYIQRRSVPRDTTAAAIRALPENVRYFLAVRAFNARNEESAFSQEVAVMTGDPASATARLYGKVDGGTVGKNPLQQKPIQHVPGESGSGTVVLLLVLLSATIGTVVAVRRQLIASPKL